MNIGIRLHDTLGASLAEHLCAAKAQGFDCVHIAMSRAVSGFQMQDAPTLLTDALADEVRTQLKQYGQTCVLLGCYLNLCTPDLEEYARTLEIYKAHLRFAKKIGALLVGTETGAPNAEYRSCPECFTEEALQLFIQRLTPVVRYAEEIGQLLAIEPVASHIVSTPERCQRVVNAVRSPFLRVIIDAVNLLNTANVEQRDAVVLDAISRLGIHAALLHMKDCRHVILTTAEGPADTVQSMACGLGELNMRPLVALARQRQLPMTLEDTTPDNAEAARQYLENIACDAP